MLASSYMANVEANSKQKQEERFLLPPPPQRKSGRFLKKWGRNRHRDHKRLQCLMAKNLTMTPRSSDDFGQVSDHTTLKSLMVSSTWGEKFWMIAAFFVQSRQVKFASSATAHTAQSHSLVGTCEHKSRTANMKQLAFVHSYKVGILFLSTYILCLHIKRVLLFKITI